VRTESIAWSMRAEYSIAAKAMAQPSSAQAPCEWRFGRIAISISRLSATAATRANGNWDKNPYGASRGQAARVRRRPKHGLWMGMAGVCDAIGVPDRDHVTWNTPA